MKSFPGRNHKYDLIIVGAGITGSELAMRCAKNDLDVLLITTSLDTVYNLLGDGTTLDAPENSLMSEIVEGIGEAGYVQNFECHRRAKMLIEEQDGIHALQSSVMSLLVEDGAIKGVSTWEGVDRFSERVVLCVGSFLEARLQIGISLSETAGRLSEMAYDDLFEDLQSQGFIFKSLRLDAISDGKSLPYSVDCKVFAADEWDSESYRLERIQGLYAAGICAEWYLPYEAAAASGLRLADKLIEELKS